MFLVKPVYDTESIWCGIRYCGIYSCDSDDCVIYFCGADLPAPKDPPTD